MASLGGTFDPQDVPEDERNFPPLPAGDYECQIIESEVIKTKSGGDMLKLTLEVMNAPHGYTTRVWDNLNIRNSNPQAQQIAHRALADLCAACGTGPIQDSEELHYKPFIATLKVEPERTDDNTGKTYDARNGVKRYKPRGGQPPAGKAPVQAAQRPAPQQGSAPRPNGAAPSRPWANRGQPEAARQQFSDDIPF